MKLIINKNNKKLTFPKLDLSLESEEIKKVSDNLFLELIGNASIQEVKKETKNKIKKKIKGREDRKNNN